MILQKPSDLKLPQSLLTYISSAKPSDLNLLWQTREVDDETGLKMVRGAEGSSDLLWRYLDYLVCQQGSAQPALHTELALTLTDATMRSLPATPDTGGLQH